MPAGTFGFWPAEMKHFAWAKGETVLQLHGTGPWMISPMVHASQRINVPKESAGGHYEKEPGFHFYLGFSGDGVPELCSEL